MRVWSEFRCHNVCVASDEILKRIDEHMARGNEHMARGNELMEEIRREHQLNRGEHQLNRREHELNRAAFAENARVMTRLTAVLERIDRSQQSLQAEIRDHRDETRVQTQAILKLLDRFRGGEPGTATA